MSADFMTGYSDSGFESPEGLETNQIALRNSNSIRIEEGFMILVNKYSEDMGGTYKRSLNGASNMT